MGKTLCSGGKQGIRKKTKKRTRTMNKQADRMKLDELQTAIEDAEQQEQQQEETAVRSEQERKQLVDAIVKAVSKDFLDTQVRLAEGIEKCFNQLNKSIAERISYMAKAVIADFHKNRIHPDDFEKLKKEVAELKELSQSGVKIAQRIDKRREEQDSRVKIPLLLFYCLTTTFVFLILFFGLCIWANIEVVHNEKLSYCLYVIGGMIVFMNALFIGVYRWLENGY